MRGCLVFLLVVVLLVGGCTATAAYYIAAPDLPPLRSYLPSWDDIADRIPFLQPTLEELPPLDPAFERRLEEERAQIQAPRQALREREAQATAQLQGAGLPIQNVFIEETNKGEPVLTVAVSFEELARGFSTSGGLAEAAQALVRIVETKALDLSGLAYTTVAVRDSQGRTLFGVTAATGDIERFRTGQISRREFIQRTAAKAESRAGVLDALRKLGRP